MWKVLQLTLQLLCFVVLGAAKDDHEEAQCFSPKLMAEVFPSLHGFNISLRNHFIIMSDLLESLSSLLIYSRLTTQRCVIYENVCTVSSAVRARTWVCLNSPLTSVHLCSVAQPSIRCLAKLFKKASKKACLRALRKEFGKRSKRMQSSSNLSRHQRCSNNTYFVTTYVCCFLT